MRRVAGLHEVEGRLINQPLTLRERRDGALIEDSPLLERRERRLHAVPRSLQGGVGVEHQAEPHFGRRFLVDDGRLASEHHVDQLRRLQATWDRLEVFEAFGSFDECNVRARLDVATGPLDRRLETFDGACVGACDDNQILPPGVDRGPYLAHHLRQGDQLLAVKVTTPFGCMLVLDLNGAGAGLLENANRVSDVDGVAKTGVDVDDQRQGEHTTDRPHVIGYLAQIYEPEVRQAEVHIGESSASQIDRLKAQIGNDPRRERIWRAG